MDRLAFDLTKPVASKTAWLFLAFHRALLLRRQFDRFCADMPDPEPNRALPPDQLFGFYAWYSLWLAALYAVVEGFEKGPNHDPLLLDERVQQLF